MVEPLVAPTLTDRLREWFAVLATVALSVFAAALTLVLWLGGWSAGTEAQRIGFLGSGMLVLLALVGAGASWLWRMQFKSFEIRAGLVQVTAQSRDDT